MKHARVGQEGGGKEEANGKNGKRTELLPDTKSSLERACLSCSVDGDGESDDTTEKATETAPHYDLIKSWVRLERIPCMRSTYQKLQDNIMSIFSHPSKSDRTLKDPSTTSPRDQTLKAEPNPSLPSKSAPKRMKGEKPVAKKDNIQKTSPLLKPATRTPSSEKGDKAKFVKFKLDSETIEDVYGREAYTDDREEVMRDLLIVRMLTREQKVLLHKQRNEQIEDIYAMAALHAQQAKLAASHFAEEPSKVHASAEPLQQKKVKQKEAKRSVTPPRRTLREEEMTKFVML
eukprot:760208-Hanusia_phi.AAC.3